MEVDQAVEVIGVKTAEILELILCRVLEVHLFAVAEDRQVILIAGASPGIDIDFSLFLFGFMQYLLSCLVFICS